jgi:signal transduction histidine kinase
MLHSLRFRVLLTLIGVVLVVVGTVALFASRVTSQELRRYVMLDDERNRRLTDTLMTYYQQKKTSGNPQELVNQIGQDSGERVILTDGEGVVQADSEGQLVGQPITCEQSIPAVIISIGGTFCAPIPAPFTPGFGQPIGPAQRAGDIVFFGMSFSEPIGGSGRPMSTTPTFEAPASVKNAPDMPTIVIWRTQGEELDPIEAGFIGAVNRALIWSVVAAGIAALLLTLLLSRRILGPVEALTSAARGMERGDLSRRVQVASRDEIGELARAFNAMADGLARQERLRRNMVTDIAHELRTPLTNIRGYLEALRDGVARPEPELLGSLHDEALLLNRLIDDLRDLALAEAGQLRLDPRPTALPEIVEQTLSVLRPALDEKQLTLDVELAPDLPELAADPERVGQVLRNLINNAVIHTPAGGWILLRATTATNDPFDGVYPEERRAQGRQRPTTSDRDLGALSFVVVTVCDNGTGIAPEHLPNVFERFYRADRSRARATGGAGLGLAIVKQLVEAHGGRVWAESAPGQGARFSFTLPAARAELHDSLTYT